jgi:uncharacterized protein (TIGR04551 family)
MCLRKWFFVYLIFGSGELLAEKSADLPLPPFANEVKGKPFFGKLSDDEMGMLKTNIKAEILQELKAPEQEWKQEVQPKLNFLALDGYLRMRTDAFNHCDLGTYDPTVDSAKDPGSGEGTSGCPPPLSYLDETTGAGPGQKPSWLLSANIRLRVNPTLNVSEDIRIKGTVDVFDNLVLGSTPLYMTGLSLPNPNIPSSILASTQNTPLIGINNPYGSINVKRLWGEVTTPAGELRFGRMPIHFGIGLFYNAGNLDINDQGDNVDGVMFATRVLGHYLIPGVSMSYTGAVGRGRGYNLERKSGKMLVNSELGQRYDLDPADNVYSVFLMFSKKDKEIDAKVLLDEGKVVLNYGVLGSYRFQLRDSEYSQFKDGLLDFALYKDKMVERNGHLGVFSLWGDVRFYKLHIEAEAVGVFGHIAEPQTWITQGGFALKSKYMFLKDRLDVGLDIGWASGGQGEGHFADFRFNPDYRIDMLLFDQVLGVISNAYYLRPHIGYFFTDNLAVRGDIISSFAGLAQTTSGKSNLLGLEIDGSLVYQSEEGFHVMLQYGFLVPFAGLNHDDKMLKKDFKTASTASALRLFAGISF